MELSNISINKFAQITDRRHDKREGPKRENEGQFRSSSIDDRGRAQEMQRCMWRMVAIGDTITGYVLSNL